MRIGSCLALLLGLVALPPALSQEKSPFDEPERTITSSPGTPASQSFAAGERIIDFDTSPGGGEVALITGPRSGAGPFSVSIWKPGAGAPTLIWKAPAGQALGAIAFHPANRAVFLLATQGGESQILTLVEGRPEWRSTVIFRSKEKLRRLVVGPRPFMTGQEDGRPRFRIFFGVAVPGGAWAIHAITDDGKLEYQLAGPKASRTRFQNEKHPDEAPKDYEVPSALPLSFHPAGHILIWEDSNKNFQAAHYDGAFWGKTSPLYGGALSGGTVTALPNGLGVLHWKASVPGARVVTRQGKSSDPIVQELTFTGTPSLMPDGKGLVGLTREGKDGPETLRFVPVRIPLGDVVNAWMFSEGEDDVPLLEKKGGLFRRFGGEQLYSFYESELYYCGGYGETTPTRPYLVTTDVLWEVWAAAYEGLFIIRERQQAVPAFWAFVDAATEELQKSAPQSRWARLFEAARASRDSATKNEEARRIRNHAGPATSSALGETFDFAELKPRGHYSGRPHLTAYFSAMRYLTAAGKVAGETKVLENLSQPVKTKALAWISAYEPFIAPSRSPRLFGTDSKTRPWMLHPGKDPVLFPLSWGFDNEVLDSTVFHSAWPQKEQITGPSGPRLVPSGLDVAAAFGSQLARTLLAADLQKYPPLKDALDRLASRRPTKEGAGTLYDRWLEALAAQWADEALGALPGSAEIWGKKRVQTGLASWTTLRHATVLVNERTEAECGEAGFEELIMRPPRGAVEPDPRTFEAIAGLFDEAVRILDAGAAFQGNLPPRDYEERQKPEPLRQGLTKRLRESAAKARLFASMARKQMKGEALSPAEYEDILYLGRVAEHHFLVYKSLANEELALSTPDPMAKVADVAGGGQVPYLLAAVGSPLELDLVVPFFGRRQIVKGATYSFHEWTSRQVMNDAEWRKRAEREPLSPWIDPFVSKTRLSCPAKPPF